MKYVAAVSGHGERVDHVKEQLLQSNPVLEGKVIWLTVTRIFLHSDSKKMGEELQHIKNIVVI